MLESDVKVSGLICERHFNRCCTMRMYGVSFVQLTRLEPLAPMEMYVWLVVLISTKVEWRCVSTTSGGQSVMMAGIQLMLLLFVYSWDLLTLEVSLMQNIVIGTNGNSTKGIMNSKEHPYKHSLKYTLTSATFCFPNSESSFNEL